MRSVPIDSSPLAPKLVVSRTVSVSAPLSAVAVSSVLTLAAPGALNTSMPSVSASLSGMNSWIVPPGWNGL